MSTVLSGSSGTSSTDRGETRCWSGLWRGGAASGSGGSGLSGGGGAGSASSGGAATTTTAGSSGVGAAFAAGRSGVAASARSASGWWLLLGSRVGGSSPTSTRGRTNTGPRGEGGPISTDPGGIMRSLLRSGRSRRSAADMDRAGWCAIGGLCGSLTCVYGSFATKPGHKMNRQKLAAVRH